MMSGGLPPISQSHSPMSAHVSEQFPGQNPAQFAAPYRPALSPGGVFGAAADYYGDQGQSVQYQPGVRPQQPSVIIPADTPHLMAASAVANPPAETGNGSAADYFGSTSNTPQGPPSIQPSASKPPRPGMSGSFGSSPGPSKPPRPHSSKPSSSSKPSKPSKIPAGAALAGGAALGYALGHESESHQSSAQVNGAQNTSVSFYQQDSNVPVGASALSLAATDGSHADDLYGPPAPIKPPRPGKHSESSHSNLPLYAAGAAGLAAGAYGLHHYGSNQHSSSMPGAFPESSQQYGGPSPSAGPYMSGGMATIGTGHQHRGPVTKLVDWWKDYEDVRRMEEYTEYIGVCRECFDPRTTPADAPRKHNYSRRRSSELRPSGINKESRYYPSDSESRRKGKGKASLIATGITGYGIAKVGKALWKQKNDFDTYSIKSGLEARSRTSLASSSRSRSPKRRTSQAIEVRRRTDSSDRIETGITQEGKTYKIVRHRSRSASPRRDHKGALVGAALGAAAGAAVVSHSRKKHRSRSNSPQREYVRHRKRSSDYERRQTKSYRSSRSSLSSSSIVDISRTERSQSGGMFGGFFSKAPEKRKKVHTKKRKGFFNFGNGSSSSSNSELAFGYGYVRKRKSKKRQDSDEDLKATLAGLTTTAAAISVAQGRSKRGKSKSELVAVRESKGKGKGKHQIYLPDHSPHSSSDEEDGWESAAEDDASESSGVMSGLAFGDFNFSDKRKSQESLLSESSGTSKWGWRWGTRKKKKVPSPTTSSGSLIGPTVAGMAGAAVIGNSLGRNESAMSSSVSSVPTLQSFYAMPTPGDPNSYDAVRRTGSTSSQSQSIQITRPENVSLQHPQPKQTVPGTLYTSKQPIQSSYAAPNGPSVFANTSPQIPSQPASFQPGLVESPEQGFSSSFEERPPRMPPRRGNSSPILSSMRRDTAIGVAAGVAAGTVAASMASRHQRRQSSPMSNVRFELTEQQSQDQAKKEDRERQKAQARKDEEIRRRERQRREEEEARRKEIESLELLEAEKRREERRQRERAERRARDKQEAEEAERRARDAQLEAQRTADIEREAERIRLERENAAREAARRDIAVRQEAERLQKEREVARLERERLQRQYEEDRIRQEEEDRIRREGEDRIRREEEDRIRREEEYRIHREEEDRIRREQEALERQRKEDLNREIFRREQEFKEHEQVVVQPDSWKPSAAGVAGATAAAAAAAIVTSAINEHHGEAPAVRTVEPPTVRVVKPPEVRTVEPSSVRHVEPTKVVDDLDDEDIFDPNLFKKDQKTREAEIARKAASKVIEDFEDRYNEGPVSQAEFFAPPELRDNSAAQSPRIDPNEGTDIQVYQAHDFNILGGPRAPPYPPSYSFDLGKETLGSSLMRLPYPIPILNLIQPTPPGSRASSVRAPSMPPSPAIVPQDQQDKSREEEGDAIQGPSSSRVSWGEDQTIHYEVETPDSYRETYTSDRDSKINEPEQSPYEIVVEPDSPQSVVRNTIYKVDEFRFSSPEAEVVDSRTVDNEPVYESHSPEVEPVVIEPDEDVGRHGAFYQSPFFETASDLALGRPTRGGFVEGEIVDEPEPTKKDAMPGAFDESPPDSEAIQEPEFERPLSKKEKKKLEREAKRQSMEMEIIPEVVPAPAQEAPAEEFEVKTSKKGKKKGKKSRGASRDDTPTAASASEPSTPPPQFEEFSSSKGTKDKKIQPIAVERDIRDIEPTAHEEEFQKYQGLKNQPSQGGVYVGASQPTGYFIPAAAASGFAAVTAAAAAQHQDTKRSDSTSSSGGYSPTSHPVTGGYSSISKQPDTSHTYSNGNREASQQLNEPIVTIPSAAFDDVQELADAKKPGKKEKRRSSGKYGSLTLESPLRSEVDSKDYIGLEDKPEVQRQPVVDPFYAVDVPLPESAVNDLEEPETPGSRKETVLSREVALEDVDQSGKSKSPKPSRKDDRTEPEQYDVKALVADDYEDRKSKRRNERSVSEEYSARERDEEHHRSSTARSEGYEDKKSSKHRRRDSEKYDDKDGQSVVSEDRYDDDGERRKHRHHKHRDTDKYDDRDARSVVSEDRDEDGERKKHRHHRRRESEKYDDQDTRSVVSEDRYDEDGERKKHRHHRRRESEKYDDQDTRSVVSEDRYDEDGGLKKHRHHRRRESEKYDDQDTRSVVSEDRYDENGERRRLKHKRHDSERNGSLEVHMRPSAASEPGDIYERDRKSKRRSKRDSDIPDDNASAVSSPARYNEDPKSGKEMKSGGFFGSLFGRKSSESLPEPASKSKSRDSRVEDDYDDPDKKHRRRKHRSSTHGSDDDDDSRSTKSSDRREKRKSRESRDDTGMDTRHQTTKVDLPLSQIPVSRLED